MIRPISNSSLSILLPTLAFTFCLLVPLTIAAQTPAPTPRQTVPPEQKIEQIITKAIEVLGGTNYLNVRTVVGKGFYSPFQEGLAQVPSRFVDYVAFPDRERTEFTGGGARIVQSNFGEAGWVFDGATKTISDMKAPQIDDFKRSMRTNVENLLRGWWRKEGGKLSYAGRREAGLAKRNETVRLTYPDGFWVEFEFGAQDGLPAKIIYKANRRNPDTGDNEEVTEQDVLAKMITVDGVTAPWVIDHFVNGVQTSRVNYESIEYNKPLPDSLFAKPDNIKSIK